MYSISANNSSFCLKLGERKEKEKMNELWERTHEAETWKTARYYWYVWGENTFLDLILLMPFSNRVSRFLRSLKFKLPRDSPSICLKICMSRHTNGKCIKIGIYGTKHKNTCLTTTCLNSAIDVFADAAWWLLVGRTETHILSFMRNYSQIFIIKQAILPWISFRVHKRQKATDPKESAHSE